MKFGENNLKIFVGIFQPSKMPPALTAFGVAAAIVAFMMNFAIHKIEEGHVGVYYRVRKSARSFNESIC